MADTGRVISFHAFAGTPPSGVRTTAIWGETNNPTGRALQGFNFSSTGGGAGMWGETASAAGTGIRARATASTGSSTAGFFDVAWLDGCPLLEDLRRTPRFLEVRADVSAKCRDVMEILDVTGER